ncbi:hypothetical protein PYCCODRAFT_1466882 [Trametes coccinea BRFM310]|uniref:BTB domain-containing protein n=1 Tax=Trametes coccinea (strain BRFM310) TaxID=1353009 RepID=A0A1Y2IQW2_TRAC3|nr:hypothetical protein PYCCODRAFT_1466882 [Trametes coccinea BRFM310]
MLHLGTLRTHGFTTPTVHPRFSFPDADVTLRSSDDVLFRISSSDLRRTSEFFRAMYTLPQRPDTATAQEKLQMSEPAQVLADMLSMIDGGELPALDNAEKYEMPFVTSVCRLAMSSPKLRRSSKPIRSYGIACRMSWEEEAKMASTDTLDMDMDGLWSETQQLGDLARPHLDALRDLHMRRKATFLASLDDRQIFPARLVGGSCPRCHPPNTPKLGHRGWWALKYALAKRWDTQPPGRHYRGVGDFLELAKLWDLSESKCAHCSMPLYPEFRLIMQRLQSIIYALPKEIEVSSSEFLPNPEEHDRISWKDRDENAL